MIIFFENGRLGNQLFQYCGLKKLQKNGKLNVVGMYKLTSLFEGIEINNDEMFYKIINKIVCFLGENRIKFITNKLHIIGSIEEVITSSGCKYYKKNGIIRNIHYCSTAYFQSEYMVDDEIISKLKIKSDINEYAASILSRYCLNGLETFFVHVRRGDYVYWPNQAPAVLPLKWYQNRMDQIRASFKTPFFIVVSDDKPYADEMFSDCADVYISHENEETDFALMAKCYGGGILSASSFAWWAAYFVRQSNKNAFIVAPLYWAGHRKGAWFPEGIQTSWINYVEVQS